MVESLHENIIKLTINKIKHLRFQIETAFEENNITLVREKLDEYSKYMEDAIYYTYKANYYFQQQKYKMARGILLRGLSFFPFHFELNFNYAVISQVIGDFEKSFIYFAKAIKYSENDQKRQLAKDQIESLKEQLISNHVYTIHQINEMIERCNLIVAEGDERTYPIDRHNQSVVRKLLGESQGEQAFVNLYKTLFLGNVNNDLRYYFGTELFKGQMCMGHLELELKGPTLIPLSLTESNTKIEFVINGKEYRFKENDLLYNKYHYFRFNETGTLKIATSKTTFVGNPIPLTYRPHLPKLILHIFIDGLSFSYLEEQGLERLMPNTYQFFKDGFISTNCYATSEWTFPSVASLFTGKYVTNHRLFHPRFHYEFEKYNKLLPEYLREAGYFTAQICNNWRITPTHGYYKGFDRILYKNFLGGMDCKEVIMETVEHLEAIQTNQYLWIALSDLHHVPDEIEDNLISQSQTDVYYRQRSGKKGPTTVLTPYDENKIERYFHEIKRLDIYLGILFDYLSKKFVQDEMIVVLNSDHGQTFLDNSTDFILNAKRLKVPLMVKGKNVPQLISDELIESVDVLPIILKLNDIEIPQNIDGNLPAAFGGQAREFVFSQSIRPERKYQASITDDKHIFRFMTTKDVAMDGTIDLESYHADILNKKTLEDESLQFEDKLKRYEQIVFERIKNWIRISTSS